MKTPSESPEEISKSLELAKKLLGKKVEVTYRSSSRNKTSKTWFCI